MDIFWNYTINILIFIIILDKSLYKGLHTLDSATEGVLAPLENTPCPDFPVVSYKKTFFD